MQLCRLAWKDRTTFTRRLVTDRDHKIERLARKLVPGFAVRLAGIDAMAPQSFNGAWMHMPGRETSGTPGLEPALSQIIQQGLGHD